MTVNQTEPVPELSPEQWTFIAVLDAFHAPISIELAGHLAPLLPGPLFDLLEKTQPLGWIKRQENNRFAIGTLLPAEAQAHIRAINTPEHINTLARKITQGNVLEKIDPQEKLIFLDKAGWIKEAGECELDLAQRAFKENRREEARLYFGQAADRLIKMVHQKGVGELFVSASLGFSNLCFSLGQGLVELESLLLEALKTAGRSGDRRAHVLLKLHLGLLFYFSDRRDEALSAFSAGLKELEDLDDEDIRGQSAEFLGIFYFIKGQLREALDQFYRAEKIKQSSPGHFSINPLMSVFLGYCATFAGQFHQAIGSLDFNWHLAMEQSDRALASTLRAVLGNTLVLLRKDREGLNHLQNAQKEAEKTHNAMGLYLAGGGLAQYHFLRGQADKAYEILKETLLFGKSAGLIRQFASPWIFEMLHEFHRLGFEPIPDWEFPALSERLLSGPNILLKGVTLRFLAKESQNKAETRELVISLLAESELLLEQAGDPVQLSKTILEKARLELRQGNQDSAREFLQKAKNRLGGYGEEFFPDEFRYLLDKQKGVSDSKSSSEAFLEGYLEMVESLYPGETQSEILNKMLNSTSRMFGAERSGLFWFPSGKYVPHPEMRAANNLTQREVAAEGFGKSLDQIRKAFRNGQPLIGRDVMDQHSEITPPVRSSMCIPIEIDGKIHGVLYYDNSYLDDAFNFSDPSILKKMVKHTNMVIERRFHYLKTKEQQDQQASGESIQTKPEKEEIIHRSRTMADLLKQADHIAKTESSVLILGETGTGKELLAKRIHEHSSRNKGPFIVVDVTTIPETLLESELFGHERGAFTGADSRKIGRLELAHQGTLFLDEIGELPLPAQTKLLRVIQERTFTRLGGIRPINSHFRLLAATNRRLEEEVAAGRFRQDLFYRLNVIPLNLPPLRERPEDIPLLAEYFMKQYALKYKRNMIRLTSEQEKLLRHYRWPGNIRELNNVMERAVLLSTETQLELNLPADLQANPVNPFFDFPSMDELQRRYIEFVFKKTGGKIAGAGGAADILGMNRTTLYSRMKLLGLRT
jgi:transcriptional regulator with GAF, ATPase, and Fis domain